MGDRIEKLEIDSHPSPIEDIEIISLLFKTTSSNDQSDDTSTESHLSCNHAPPPDSTATDILAMSIVFVVLSSPQFNTIVEKLTKDKNYNLIIKLILFIIVAYLYKSRLFF